MDYEMLKLRRYMLHHRIITYAIILFLILITFILMSISRQIQNEQALLLDSQAAGATRQVKVSATCPASGMPARLTYNGATSCYFGQYRSVSIRCNVGDRAQIINASTVGAFSVCADKSVLEAAAKARCGCMGAGPTPTTGGGAIVPGQPTVIPTTAPIAPTAASGSISICKRGLNSFAVGIDCETDPADPPAYRSASYTCQGGKKGVVTPTTGLCMDITSLYSQAVAACKNESNCKPTPTFGVIRTSPFPTFVP